MKWNIPYIQIYSYLKLFNLPLLQGSILGSITYILTIILVKKVGIFLVEPDKFSASYDGIVLEESEKASIKTVSLFRLLLEHVYFIKHC
jgi:hypothetical protein